MDKNTDDNKYLRAKERVMELKKFYGHLWSYLTVMAILAMINYFTNGFGYMWFLWAAFGWGIGITAHAIATFRLNPFFGKDWEERKIREYMQEEEKTTNKWE